MKPRDHSRPLRIRRYPSPRPSGLETPRSEMTTSKDNTDPLGEWEDVNDVITSSHASAISPEPEIPLVPDLFLEFPPIRDSLATHTSELQDQTVQDILPYLAGLETDVRYNAHGVPQLRRAAHIRFLKKMLGPLPPQFLAADASRPWFLYWCLASLALLGEDLAPYQETLASTARSMQNSSGGFGGGPGHASHLATTYAVVLSIALVGGDEAYDVVDRRAMWKWLCSLKQPGGGFQMANGGEVDVRGAFCATVIISLLNLPLDLTPESPAWTPDRPNLYTGLEDYVRRCQTYEGGISGKPDAEAHGAYAFCALGCLSILDAPHRIIPKSLDVPKFISWLSSRQYAPEGGMAGRTNKVVDGCYSHWVGACWPLVEAALRGPSRGPSHGSVSDGQSLGRDLPAAQNKTLIAKEGPQLLPNNQSLFSREGLIRYILCCCQDTTKRGGLRDKPSKPSDAYHTCYVLSGLSSVQHRWTLVPREGEEGVFSWHTEPLIDPLQVFDASALVRPTHPVYTIPRESVDDIQTYFLAKSGF